MEIEHRNVKDILNQTSTRASRNRVIKEITNGIVKEPFKSKDKWQLKVESERKLKVNTKE